MKLVKEYINEKFTEDSDPIFDMGIGMIDQIKKFVQEQGHQYNLDGALWICAKKGKLEFVKFLLDKGANVHEKGNMALRWASSNGHKEIVELLLQRGADVNAMGDDALRGASANGQKEVVELLLQHGADVHADHDYALQLAKKYGRTNVVKVLQDHIAKENKGLVKESLLEKFTEDSDPIKDMDIGRQKFNKKLFINKMLPYYYSSAIPNMTIYNGLVQIIEEDSTFIKIDGNKIIIVDKSPKKVLLNYLRNAIWATDKIVLLNKNKNTLIIKLREPLAESMNEKFTEDSDPIKDMDIGRQKLYKDAFIEQLVGPNPGGLFNPFLRNYLTSMIRLDTTYIKIEGNKITITESESPKGAFFTYLYYALDGNRNIKSMKKGVKRMIITLYEPLVESMNEKFVEDSDPIKDMKIGFDPNTFEGYLRIAGYDNIIVQNKSIFEELIRVSFSKGDYEFRFSVYANYTKSGMRGFNGFKPWISWKRNENISWNYLGGSHTRILKSTQEEYLVRVLKIKLKQIKKFLT